MNKQEILIRKRRAIDVPVSPRPRQENLYDPRALTLQAEAMRLGFMLSETLMRRLSTVSDTRIGQLYKRIVPVLRHATGDDAATWEPFYPNFPKQVVEASDIELFLNAILHYWTSGQWRPQFTKDTRLPAFEAAEFTTIGLADSDDILAVFSEILGANASVADTDRAVMVEILDHVSEEKLAAALPESIPFKENLCWFVGECFDRCWNMVGMSVLKTATDILRVATHLSGGDISLAENTRFKSFSRPLRRAMVERLNQVANKDDVFRHRGKWVRLAHSLHIGEYASADHAKRLLSEARCGDYKYRTFDGRVEAAIRRRNRKALVDLLKTRPGVFARRLDHIIRTFGARGVVIPFLSVADDVDTRVLLQLYGHFNTRTEEVSRRLVFPRGGQGKSRLLTQTLPAIAQETVDSLRKGIEHVLYNRFEQLDELGESVYVDPALKDCPVPLSLRSASDSLVTVARGTKLPIGDKGTIRMFIYWKGQDIDLSGFFVNANFTKQDTISYYNLREGFSCHSGDITSAPHGACEFIDVDIEKALAAGGHRYLVMSVLVYDGPKFSEHEVCYAGWMTRSKVQSNEIFDPKTVEQKVDLTVASQNAIPVIFDLRERKAIWLDLAVSRRHSNMCRPNNVANNKSCLFDSVEGAMNLENKPTLYDLFMMHAEARAQYIVEDPEEADFVFGWNGDVKPTDTTTILSDYLM